MEDIFEEFRMILFRCLFIRPIW